MGDHCKDLEEIFTQIRKRNIRLNLDKFAFKVKASKFLGLKIIRRRIEANPNKCPAIIEMRSPSTMKEL